MAGVIIPTDSVQTCSQPKQSDWFDEYERELARLLDQKADIEEQINELRQKLLKQMDCVRPNKKEASIIVKRIKPEAEP